MSVTRLGRACWKALLRKHRISSCSTTGLKVEEQCFVPVFMLIEPVRLVNHKVWRSPHNNVTVGTKDQ